MTGPDPGRVPRWVGPISGQIAVSDPVHAPCSVVISIRRLGRCRQVEKHQMRFISHQRRQPPSVDVAIAWRRRGPRYACGGVLYGQAASRQAVRAVVAGFDGTSLGAAAVAEAARSVGPKGMVFVVAPLRRRGTCSAGHRPAAGWTMFGAPGGRCSMICGASTTPCPEPDSYPSWSADDRPTRSQVPLPSAEPRRSSWAPDPPDACAGWAGPSRRSFSAWPPYR